MKDHNSFYGSCGAFFARGIGVDLVKMRASCMCYSRVIVINTYSPLTFTTSLRPCVLHYCLICSERMMEKNGGWNLLRG